MASQILLFEGIANRKGGKRGMAGTLAGRHCIRKTRKYSKKLGKNVTRCAAYSGGGLFGGLGALPFNLDQFKDTFMTGAVAVVGAGVSNQVVDKWIGPLFKTAPDSYLSMGLEVGLGVIGGWAITKYTGKADLGAAFSIGPLVYNGMKLVQLFVMPIMAGEEAAAEVSGNNPALGVMIPQEEWPPEGVFQNPYAQFLQNQAQQQQQQQAEGAWAY